jgi:predicted DNA-binding protein (UPF0278 family)
LEIKKEMLVKLDKLKPESSLYTSHRRTILKEYLEQLRERVGKQQQVNERLVAQGLTYQKMKEEDEEVMRMYRESASQLEASRLL